MPTQCGDPAAVDRRAVGRGASLERSGRYLVWSDIPNNWQLRWLEDDGHVSVFRMPTNNSNGNTFDFQGRQVTCEHLGRRVIRYELDGSRPLSPTTTTASASIRPTMSWPIRMAASGSPIRLTAASSTRASPTRRADRPGHMNARLGQPAGFVPGKRELPTNCYRWDPSGNSISSSPRSKFPIQTASASRPTIRSSTSSAPAKAWRHRSRRQGRYFSLRCRLRQQALEPEAVHRLRH